MEVLLATALDRRRYLGAALGVTAVRLGAAAGRRRPRHRRWRRPPSGGTPGLVADAAGRAARAPAGRAGAGRGGRPAGRTGARVPRRSPGRWSPGRCCWASSAGCSDCRSAVLKTSPFGWTPVIPAEPFAAGSGRRPDAGGRAAAPRSRRAPSGDATSRPRRLTGTVLPAVTATRYVTPLREGGSLPGLMEADDLGTYVVKWRAAGQGVNVLVAEVVCAELARALGLPVPAAGDRRRRARAGGGGARRRGAGAPAALRRAQPRHGLPARRARLRGGRRRRRLRRSPAGCCGSTPWSGNVDRSWRNPNMLFWHGRLQLIDHGAALTFHHHWPGAAAAVDRPYDAAAHALIECEPDVPAADAALAAAGDPAAARGGAGAGARRLAGGGARTTSGSATSPSCSRGWRRGTPGCPAWSPRPRPGEAGAAVRPGARTGRRGWARRRPRG